MDKNKYIYAGILLFVGLVIYSSTRKFEMEEVIDPSGGKLAAANGNSVDKKRTPSFLQPPIKLAEGDNYVPSLIKKSITGISFKPRFDIR